MIKFEKSERLKKLAPYLFVEIDKAKSRARDEGRDIIDLGVGDPDLPTPRSIIDALARAAHDPKTHRYSLDQGIPEFRTAAAKWFKRRFGVDLDPDAQIYPLIGSKEGIAHMPLAFVNPGDMVLVPDPCYPPYISGTIFAGGEALHMPLDEKNGYLPDLKAINHHLLHKVRMMFINYPNNPTAATCDKRFLKDVVDFAIKHNIIICHDAAYSEIAFDGFKPSSILEIDGGRETSVEFHSLSKTFNMTGWRIGFVAGSAQIIEGLAKVKANVDSGIFSAIQRAGATALDDYERHINSAIKVYEERRNILVDGLNGLGWNVKKPKGTFYVWAKALARYTSATLAKALLEKADIVVTPGNGFGQHGEGYVRMALTIDKNRIREAIERIRKRLV